MCRGLSHRDRGATISRRAWAPPSKYVRSSQVHIELRARGPRRGGLEGPTERSTLRTLQLVVLGCALTGTAHAQSQARARLGGEGLSLHAGRPLGNGSTAVFTQGGWPGISAGMLHGVTDQTDLG